MSGWLYRVALVSLALAGALLFPVAQAEEDRLAPGMVNPGYVDKPAWFKESFLDIREDIAEASAAGKRVLLYFYQDGCPYCARLLNENLSQEDIVNTLRQRFDVIAINLWGDREVTGVDGQVTTEKEFARANRIMFTPTLLFLDEQGAHVLRLNGYYHPHKFRAALDYVKDHREAEMPYTAYLAQVSPAPASGKLHQSPGFLQPPHDLSRRSGERPLLVLFEQKQCTPCDELHEDILKQPGSADLLTRFDVVLLDAWSDTPLTTPQGQVTRADEWARGLAVNYIPTMILMDVQGREVIRAEGWLRTFHVQSLLDYVASGAYLEQPEFQRYIEARADTLRAQGIEVDLLQ